MSLFLIKWKHYTASDLITSCMLPDIKLSILQVEIVLLIEQINVVLQFSANKWEKIKLTNNWIKMETIAIPFLCKCFYM